MHASRNVWVLGKGSYTTPTHSFAHKLGSSNGQLQGQFAENLR